MSSTYGKRHIGYFVNWGIYGRKYFPKDIPVEHLTHINYAFANVNRKSGEVSLSDTWADIEIHFDGDSWNEPGTNLYGCLKALYLLKKRYRNLKVLLSIGGWSYSPNFADIVQQNWRDNFVRSAVKLVEDVGLDGLDVDYEYPKTPQEDQAYVELLRGLRAGLDQLAQSKGRPGGQYELSIAAPCGWDNMSHLPVQQMDQYLDFWNLMAYDFAGSWDQVAGHQSALFSANENAPSADKALRFYMSRGVAAQKLVLGMPLYGQAFANTTGIGQPFQGVGEGSWESGMWDYKALPRPGSQIIEDPHLGASYCYDPQQRLLVSYDTPNITAHKARHICDTGLGGAMWWELDADKPEQSGESLVRIAVGNIGQLQWRENELHYPGSKYENLRRGME